MEQHPLFIKYTRAWLHSKTGFSKGYLSRVSTGSASLSRSFIERVADTLNEPERELFLPQPKRALPCVRSGSRLGNWLEKKCREEHLSLRQAAARTRLSHTTISGIIRGSRPLPETVGKLTQGFSGNGHLPLLPSVYL